MKIDISGLINDASTYYLQAIPFGYFFHFASNSTVLSESICL